MITVMVTATGTVTAMITVMVTATGTVTTMIAVMVTATGTVTAMITVMITATDTVTTMVTVIVTVPATDTAMITVMVTATGTVTAMITAIVMATGVVTVSAMITVMGSAPMMCGCGFRFTTAITVTMNTGTTVAAPVTFVPGINRHGCGHFSFPFFSSPTTTEAPRVFFFFANQTPFSFVVVVVVGCCCCCCCCLFLFFSFPSFSCFFYCALSRLCVSLPSLSSSASPPSYHTLYPIFSPVYVADRRMASGTWRSRRTLSKPWPDGTRARRGCGTCPSLSTR